MNLLRRVPTATKPLTEDVALYGAAYRVVFELVGNPDNCATPELLAVLGRTVLDVRAWSRTQDAPVARAYERACVDVLERAKTVVENTLRYQHMMTLYATIPRPVPAQRDERVA